MNKQVSKSMLWAFVTLIVLGMSYWFCRFFMLDIHGMKQLPTLLGIVAFVVLVLSLILKRYWISATTDLGYIGGFVTALLLNSDGVDAGGAKANNLWIIWTAILLACIVTGLVIEIVVNQKRLNKCDYKQFTLCRHFIQDLGGQNNLSQGIVAVAVDKFYFIGEQNEWKTKERK